MPSARVPVPDFARADVAEAFATVPEQPRKKLLRLRRLIFDISKRMPEVGELEETLKWGEPSYLTRNKSGTTIRIHWKERRPDRCALYVHCQTNLIERFRQLHGDELEFEGTRAVLFPVKDRFPKKALTDCVELALTYHLG